MSDVFVIASLVACSSAGALAGFMAGLVPGLHMNNFAVLVVACAGALSVTSFSAGTFLVPCMLCAALVGHMFSSAVGGTYLGVPDGDSLSVLPAHRLARAGLGPIAVRSSADGTLAGVLLASLVLLPVSLLLGDPVGGYGLIQRVMLPLVVAMAVLLVASCVPSSASRRVRVRLLVLSTASFLISGCVGVAVLQSCYSASTLPDVPWIDPPTMPRSALLLPLFAGLFGLPNLLAAMRSSGIASVPRWGGPLMSPVPRPSDIAACLLAGAVVGWLPGMTSGTASAALSRGDHGSRPGEGVERSARFIWMYSAVTSAGAVMSVGALLVISRARSGTMDAVASVMCAPLDRVAAFEAGCALVSSMLLSAAVCHWMMRALEPHMAGAGARRLLSSRWASLSCIAFLCALTVYLTGLRGTLVLSAACLLSILTVSAGVRRICLMGCMMVPIALVYLERWPML